MKILKFILFFILFCVLVNSKLLAQLDSISLQILSLNSINNPTFSPVESSCTQLKTPPLIIESAEIIEIDDEKFYRVLFNESYFEKFDYYQLQVQESACDRSLILFNNEYLCPISWEEVTEPLGEDICIKNVPFRVMLFCNKNESYTNVVEQSVVYCSLDTILRKKLNEKDITISPQPATNFIYINDNPSIKLVNIYNTQGQVLFTKENNNSASLNKIELPSLVSGIYIAEIQTNEGSIHYKKISIRSN